MDIQTNKNLWIGLATVTPLADNKELGDAKGASVNVLLIAETEDKFNKTVKAKLFEYGYILEELEDVELFNFNHEYGDDLNIIAEQALRSGNLAWGTFYTFD